MDEVDAQQILTEQMLSSKIRQIHDKTVKVFEGPASDEPRYCKRCGEPISPARLKIVPGTMYCVACKAILENRNR